MTEHLGFEAQVAKVVGREGIEVVHVE